MRITQQITGLVAAMLAVLLGPGLALGQNSSDDSVLALVEGTPIHVSAVKVSPVELQWHRERLAKSPEPPSALPSASEAQLELAIEKLAGRIWEIAVRIVAARYSVSVTDDEVDSLRGRLPDSNDLSQALGRTRQKYKAVLAALALVEQGMPPDEAYGERLSKYMTPAEWEYFRKISQDSQARSEIEEMAEGANVIDPDQIDISSYVIAVLFQKLMERADEILASDDPKYGLILKTAKLNQAIARQDYRYGTERKENWWREELKHLDISILDERYRGSIDQLFKSVDGCCRLPMSRRDND